MSIWLQRGAIASITSLDERRLKVACGASSPVADLDHELGRLLELQQYLARNGDLHASRRNLGIELEIVAADAELRLLGAARRQPASDVSAEQEAPALLGAIERAAGDAGRRLWRRQDRHRAASGLFPAVAGQRRHRTGEAKCAAARRIRCRRGLSFTRRRLSLRRSVEESAESLVNARLCGNGKLVARRVGGATCRFNGLFRQHNDARPAVSRRDRRRPSSRSSG